jgi:hypothetical protein
VVTDEVERLENDPVATAPGSDFVLTTTSCWAKVGSESKPAPTSATVLTRSPRAENNSDFGLWTLDFGLWTLDV